MLLKIDRYIIKPDLSLILSELSQISNFNNVYKKTNDSYMVCCPFHADGREEHPSCGIVCVDTLKDVPFGTFNCFACSTKGPLWRFVAQVLKCSDEKAKQWLIDNFTLSTEDEEIFDLPKIEIGEVKNKRTQFLDENILKNFQSYHPYMTQRKLSKRIIEVFKIKYDPATQSLVFPVWDECGRLVMLTRRNVNSKIFMIDADKEKPLYLLNYIKQHNIQECAIVEGQIDCLTCCTYGMPAVATMGNISEHQIELINKSGIRVLYAMFDNDKSGKMFYQKLKKGIRKDILLIYVPILILGKKDVNDLSEDEFWRCIEEAKRKN